MMKQVRTNGIIFFHECFSNNHTEKDLSDHPSLKDEEHIEKLQK